MHYKEYTKLIKGMVLNDIKKEYIGSSFGFLWAFIQPISIIFVLWFVFEIGFKSKPVNDMPFILWISSGLLPWFFIANSISGATHSVISQSYLVKKISFPTFILPIIKILSNFIVHLFMMSILTLSFILYGKVPDLYWFQLFYYYFATFILLMGISWLSSSLIIFIKDIKNLIPILIQFGFWGTPIFWSLSRIPEEYHIYLKLNLFEYIIQGYRDSMINKVWFWEKTNETLYFWAITLLLLLFSYKIFMKLKSHFVDVL